MDPRVKEVVEGAMQINHADIRSLEELSESKMGNIFETCFSKNSNNAERFGDCVQ